MLSVMLSFIGLSQSYQQDGALKRGSTFCNLPKYYQYFDQVTTINCLVYPQLKMYIDWNIENGSGAQLV